MIWLPLFLYFKIWSANTCELVAVLLLMLDDVLLIVNQSNIEKQAKPMTSKITHLQFFIT
jgi:hypothetical protein